MNNTDIAKKVIEALGGRENVNSVAHCATRLRVMVKDEGKIDKNTVENLEKVQGAFFNSGQYQIIFGTGTVNKIYDEVVALGLPTSSKDDMKAEAAKQGNWFQRAIRTFGDVFVPIIPVIVATGLFMGVRGLLNALGMTLPDDVKTYTEILTDTAFIILPGLVVWSTFRVFGGNPAVGIVLGMMLVSGSLPNAWAVASGGEVTAMKFFGFIPVVGLQGSVLPAFIIGVVGAKFEKALRKVVPDVLDLLVTPFVTLFVMSICLRLHMVVSPPRRFNDVFFDVLYLFLSPVFIAFVAFFSRPSQSFVLRIILFLITIVNVFCRKINI